MKKCKKTILYTYINSGNHGCEAIARSTYDILQMNENDNYIFTSDLLKDKKMKLDEKWNLKQIPAIHGFFPISSLIPRVMRKIKIDSDALWKYLYKNLDKMFDKDTLALSTGGDVYCYDGSEWLTYLNRIASENGAKTVLWGCSIEKKRLDQRVIDDLKRYHLITVRESYTQKNLKERGIYDNVRYFPDPAFVLKKQSINLWDWNKMGKIIGINLSYHVINSDNIYQIFCDFIERILNDTEYSVVLIPHVFWEKENDLELLKRMYQDISQKSRLYLVDQEYNCMQLKYIISKCSLFMGARTHSVIAAYSSYVPALAFSYSVKSRGIAFDLFGQENNYVLPVTDEVTVKELFEHMLFLLGHSENIVAMLEGKIPQYEEMIGKEKEVIESLFDEKNRI